MTTTDGLCLESWEVETDLSDNDASQIPYGFVLFDWLVGLFAG